MHLNLLRESFLNLFMKAITAVFFAVILYAFLFDFLNHLFSSPHYYFHFYFFVYISTRIFHYLYTPLFHTLLISILLTSLTDLASSFITSFFLCFLVSISLTLSPSLYFLIFILSGVMYHHDHAYMKRLRENKEHPYGFHMYVLTYLFTQQLFVYVRSKSSIFFYFFSSIISRVWAMNSVNNKNVLFFKL